MLDYGEYLKVFIALLAILNPLGVIPIFMSLTSDARTAENTRSYGWSCFVGIILLVSLLAGKYILDFFGISVDSFRVAGGILILLMAISMLHARLSATVQTRDELSDAESRESVAVVPMATPLLAGPGAISTVILYAHKGSGLAHYLMVGLDILVVVLILFVTLRLIPIISPYISKTGINIFTRLMGLLLAAIAVEFMANGLRGLFPALS